MNPRVWFKSISLENVRSFGTKQTINFTDKAGNATRWNVILGDNGTGKTTVLKGLAQSVCDEMGLALGRFSSPLLNYFRRSGDLPMTINTVLYDSKLGTKSDEISVISGVVRVFEPGDIHHNLRETKRAICLRAYAATRQLGEDGYTGSAYDQSGGFLYDNSSLLDAERWLIEAKLVSSLPDSNYENRYDTVANILKALLRDEVVDIQIKIELGDPKVYFKTHYGDVRLYELSLGYKTLIAWMVDFAKGLLDRYPDSLDPLAEPAVCLVDELDLHLHPKFQRNIIKFLTETFPNTQFIVTAHSPLIVQSAEDANIILLKREGNETHVADGIDVHSWRIDQILSSDLFGGISSRAPQVEEKMSRRRALLRKDGRSPDEQHELNDLEKELGELPVMETREALKAIDIISKAVISEGQP